MSQEDVLRYFYKVNVIEKTKAGWKSKFTGEDLLGRKMPYDVIDAKTRKVVIEAGKKGDATIA